MQVMCQGIRQKYATQPEPTRIKAGTTSSCGRDSVGRDGDGAVWEGVDLPHGSLSPILDATTITTTPPPSQCEWLSTSFVFDSSTRNLSTVFALSVSHQSRLMVMCHIGP